MRTLLPETSITSMTTSSPSMTLSPGRRVMMSMGNGSSLEPWGTGAICRTWPSRLSTWLGRCLRLTREQGGTDGSVGSLVDHLVATAVCNQDRRAEIRTEVLQGFCRTDGHIDGSPVVIVVDADAIGLVVGELDLVAA